MVEVVIPRRFNGPPGSGNGGYSCGAVASLVDSAGAVEVTLRSPPPLNRPLHIERHNGLVSALDGDTLVAEAGPAELDVPTPPTVTLDEAEAADARSPFRDAARHPFQTCFVCGPTRAAGDGLRVFAGPIDGGHHAGVFRPDQSVATPDGRVRPEVVWAALDCPTSAPFLDWSTEAPPFLLARLTARIEAALTIREPYVCVSWLEAEEGRKRTSACVLTDAQGAVVASARALWIQVRPAT